MTELAIEYEKKPAVRYPISVAAPSADAPFLIGPKRKEQTGSTTVRVIKFHMGNLAQPITTTFLGQSTYGDISKSITSQIQAMEFPAAKSDAARSYDLSHRTFSYSKFTVPFDMELEEDDDDFVVPKYNRRSASNTVLDLTALPAKKARLSSFSPPLEDWE